MKIRLRTLFVYVFVGCVLLSLRFVSAAQDAAPRKHAIKTTEEEPSQAPFSIQIRAEQTTALIGGNLKFDVTITNTSDHDIFYAPNRREFALEVLDAQGKKVALSTQGAKTVAGDGSVFVKSLHPGKSIESAVWLNKEFDLDRPGKYTVQALRGVTRTSYARSNVIGITIVP